MNEFEAPQSSSELFADDPEPSPKTAELLSDLLAYIKILWAKHWEAKQITDDTREARLAAIELDLYNAYNELHALEEDIEKESDNIKPEIMEDARFELWIACRALHNMIKLPYTNQ